MGKSSKRTFILYYLSMDLAFCHGPVDELVQVYAKEKEVFDEDDPMLGPGVREIDKYDLFGGDEREGGLVGTLHYCDGSWSQLMPAPIAERVGLTPETAPGYRGIMHIAIHGNSSSDRPGAIVAANSPSVPPIWAEAKRFSKTLEINTNVIRNSKGYDDSNPAAMIHEAVVNADWGMGGDPDHLDTATFVAAAQTLSDENFGLSMFWDGQSSIEDFIADILDHINGLYFFNPFTGLAELKLLRDDYDHNNLPVYGPSNCFLVSFRRKLWGETTNEITVNYTDCEKEEQGSVTYQDPGNAAMQGDVKSETREFPGIRTEELALFAAQRELQSASAPLASVSIRTDRRSWKHLPGSVVQFEWPDHEIVRTTLRVLNVDWGTLDKSEIRVDLVEDIFAFQEAQFGKPGAGEWEDPTQNPNEPQFERLDATFFALPYTLIQQDLGDDAASQLTDERYPQIVTGAMVTPTPEQPDLMSFIMNVHEVSTTGADAWAAIGERQLTGKAFLVGNMVQEVTSELEIGDKFGGDGPEVGRYAILGPGDNESAHEWILFDQRIEGDRWRVFRGVLDTIPRPWDDGTPLWFIGESWDAHDAGNSLAFEAERYKLQARTTGGIRPLDSVLEHITTRPDRPYLPYRPANARVNGTMFGVEDQTQIPEGTYEPRQWMIPLTWSWRNRALEDSIVRKWDDSDLAPEDEQTTTIVCGQGYGNGVGSIGTEYTRIVNLSDNNALFDIWEYTGRRTTLNLRFISERVDFESLQGISIGLGLYVKGYGSDWGYAYGGWRPGPVIDGAEGEFQLPDITFDGHIIQES